MYKHWLSVALLLFSKMIGAEECRHLVVSGNPEYPPYLWRSDAEPSLLVGANQLLMDRIAKEVGVTVDIRFVGPWGRVQEELAAGRIDGIVGAFYTSVRTERMDYLYPPFQLTRSVIWVNKRKVFNVDNLEDLHNRQGVTVINNSFGQMFDEYARTHLSIHQVGSVEQGFRMLEDQRVDYMIYEEAPGLVYVNKLGITNIETLPYQISSEPLYLTLSKKSVCNTPSMIQKLEVALRRAEVEGWMGGYLQAAYRQLELNFRFNAQ